MVWVRIPPADGCPLIHDVFVAYMRHVSAIGNETGVPQLLARCAPRIAGSGGCAPRIDGAVRFSENVPSSLDEVERVRACQPARMTCGHRACSRAGVRNED